jgi:GT2 family glycosyltransferase
MVRRSALQAVGPLDDDFFMYAEEMDWCYRMRRGGWDVYSLPAVTCRHWGGQSSRQVSADTPARLAAATLCFFRKHYGWPRTWVLQAGMVGLGLAKAALFAGVFAASVGRRSVWRAKAQANLRLAGTGLRSNRCLPAAQLPAIVSSG